MSFDFSLSTNRPVLYQVSTSTALVEGVTQGAIRVGALREHGDLGLGTFEKLDGEMVAIDGGIFQMRGDGSVNQPGDDVLSAFAQIIRFMPDGETNLSHASDLGTLLSRFDQLRSSENLFYALRVEGDFDYMHVRAVYSSTPGTTLLNAASSQQEFTFHNVSGSLAGFWTPEYARTVSIPGYHLHFLSSDRAHGGHLLECGGSNLRLRAQRINDYHIALPTTQDFLKADLRRDPSADLAKAEGVQK